MISTALLLAAALSAAPADLPARRDRPPGAGAVEYVTATRVYLDAGAEDGLEVGQEVELRRGGEPAGRCKIETLAPTHASCTGPRAKVGDTFRFQPPAAPPEPKLLPPPPGEEELARRLAAVELSPVAPVEWKAKAGLEAKVPRARVADVGLSHASYKTTDSALRHRAAVDVVIRGAEIADGLRLDVDARAERWLSRRNERFRPGDDTQLYLWQAQLTATPGDRWVVAAGRVMPWEIPGATVFDGALAGVRGRPGGWDAEAGVFGGLVPEPDTTAPDVDRSTGGAYWGLGRALGRGASFRHEGRLAVVKTPELDDRVEGSLTARLFLRYLDLSLEAHAGAGDRGADGLTAARADVTLRPARRWLLGASARESREEWPLVEPALFPGEKRAADAFVAFELTPAIRLAATGGFSEDTASELDHRWVGPELSLPRLLGRRGGLSIGYLEETGWVGGRSAYTQVTARPWDSVRMVGRLSWSQEKDLDIDQHELGLFASVSADLTRNLGLRLSTTGRGSATRGSVPYGYSVFATVYASY